MARFLIGTIPVVGHVSPAVSIARELVKRGHEVCWYTGSAFQPTVEATGARFTPITSWLDYSYPENVPQEWMAQRESLKGPALLKFDLKCFFIDPALGQVKDCIKILNEFPADVLLADSMFLGASWISTQTGLPYAGFGTSVLALSSRDTAPFGLGVLPNPSPLGRVRNQALNWLFQQIILRDLTVYTNKLRSQLGLPASSTGFFDTLSPFLYLSPNVPDFEYPRSDLPAQIHFIGPLLPAFAIEFTPPAWWNELDGDRPVIHVTQGTVTTNPDNLIVPTLRALEHEPVLVVATTAGKPLALDPIPTNARIAPFIPHSDLMPLVDILITNGGYNGVQMALAHGVPLVVSGQTEDKPEVAARVEWAGVGINLRTKTPTPKQIREAVKTLLTEHRYKTKAKQFQTEIDRYDAPALASTLLEQLAATKQPILRPQI